MMGKNLNYAYPRKYAEGGDVQGYRRAGVEFVEHEGKMVPKDAVAALKAAVGLGGARDSAEVLRYDVNGDGRVTAHDALQFLKYGQQEDYQDNADFFNTFYNSAPQGTVTDTTVYSAPEGGATQPIATTVPAATPTFTSPVTATPTTQPATPVPTATTMPGLNLSMGDVSSAFTSNPPAPAAGQGMYQSFVTQNNPSLYTPPAQQGVGSLMDNPLLQSTTNPYLQSSAPTQSVFQRPPGG